MWIWHASFSLKSLLFLTRFSSDPFQSLVMSGRVESGVLDKGDHFRDMLLNVTHITLHACTIRVVIKSQVPLFQFSLFSQASHKSLNLRLESSHVTQVPHLCIQHTHSLNCYRLVDATELWAPERPDTETPSNPSHEHLTLNVEHTTLLYIIYSFITHTYFSFQIFFFFFYIAYLYIVLLLSVSCCCHSVALSSFGHYNKFLVCVSIPGQ